MSGESWGAEVFDRLYARDADPWNFASSPYERAKYRDTLDLLDGAGRFASGVELGCSIGVLTAMLAERCDALLGIDAADAAIERARERCASLPQVRFARGVLPEDWPEGRFDLVVISELLYFLSTADLRRLADRVLQATLPGATILLVNWTGETNTPLTGDAATDGFIAAVAPSFAVGQAIRREGYRLERLTRTS